MNVNFVCASSFFRVGFRSIILFIAIAASQAYPESWTPVESDVFFMYGQRNISVYTQFRATMVAWGMFSGQSGISWVRKMGVRTTGAFWCLSPGSADVCRDRSLTNGLVRDIEGKPIVVPWLSDDRTGNCRGWWGCVNTTAFSAWLQGKLEKESEFKPDGMHIDDPVGGTFESLTAGGCYCGDCMKKFSDWLEKRGDNKVLSRTGVRSFREFDYRNLVRAVAGTRAETVRRRDSLPLRREFEEFQLECSVSNFKRLSREARMRLGTNSSLSANLYFSDYGDDNLALAPYITHIVCEVPQMAGHGTGSLIQPLKAYRQADAIGRKMAATAIGDDWARIKDRGQVNLVKIWIALAYSCGQFFMVPDPEHQWCHDQARGTFWYQAPPEEFAPLYRFIRMNRTLFDGFETVGPLAAPSFRSNSFLEASTRQALKIALSKGDPRPLSAADGTVWVFPRWKDGAFVVHLLNLDYDSDSDRFKKKKNLKIELPSVLVPENFSKAVLRSFALKKPVTVKMTRENGTVSFEIPVLSLWSVVEFR